MVSSFPLGVGKCRRFGPHFPNAFYSVTHVIPQTPWRQFCPHNNKTPPNPPHHSPSLLPTAAMAGIRLFISAAKSLALRCPGRSHARHFAFAAAVQLDYDSDCWEDYDHCDRGRWPRPRELADACGDAEGRGVQWVFMGSPGVQKHVYASRISRLLDVPYISMGSLVRQELNPRSSLYKQIANAVNEGKLVPEDVIFALLSKRLEEGYYRGETGFILDGIPRTRVQAEILDQIADIDLVVNFKCMEDCLVKKQLGSGICSYCGKLFKLGFSESTGFNPCLSTRTRHAQLNSVAVQFTDGSHQEKFRLYKEQNQLLEDYYRKQRKLLDFQVAGGPREIWQELLAALHLQQIDAISSSQKLTS